MNTAWAKAMSSTRFRLSATEETSITRLTQPARTAAAMNANSSGASGVVSFVGRESPAKFIPSVPMAAVEAGPPSRAWTRATVVVLPLVPVTPITCRLREGSSKKRLAMALSARRSFLTCTQVTRGYSAAGGWIETTAAAPRATASAT